MKDAYTDAKGFTVDSFQGATIQLITKAMQPDGLAFLPLLFLISENWEENGWMK